ncbi:MAG: DUF3472 domain-containing protein [Sediminibacterium sp.]|nr:DUF3472 domain-containing protein [Sediminibacterium sp.]
MPLKLLLGILIVSFSVVNAQQAIIPAYTGYAIPAENEETQLFSTKTGLSNWKNTNQTISYHFFVRTPGLLNLSLFAKNAVAGSIIQVSIQGKKINKAIPASGSFKEIKIGSVIIKDTGFYIIQLKAIKKVGNTIAQIQQLKLTGIATLGMHFNAVERRNAASVHLRYPLPDSIKAIAFYNEITVPANADKLHSYYMACGFSRGYFGIQVNSEKERRVIFSVWDSGNEAVDRNKVPDSNKVALMAKGDQVIAEGFGNEGTGGHSHLVYNWKVGTTYKFLVTALNDSATATTIYTGYFFMSELQKWKLIASFKAPHDGLLLRNLYSFNENFWGVNGQLQRKAFFGNQWVQDERGRWIELTKASFSYDATGKAGDRIDYGAGIENNQFYLWNGGFMPATAQYGDSFERKLNTEKPTIDYTKNVDSAAQAKKDLALIAQMVSDKKVDTTAQIDGVYYHVLKEGTGATVAVTDTVTVFYKGSLLSDGSIFDQTKEKPATFPLSRLIKGWQIGLPMCKEGGTIRLIIPSGLAYTIRSRSKNIPPNSVLVFDISVVKTKPKQ